MSNKKISIVRKILITILIVFLVIQFIRPERNNGLADGPNDITHFVQVPDTIQHILKTSCYDCHSNHTVYPWYALINPVGLWLRDHINDGKRSINFSDLSGFTKKKLDHRMGDITETVEKGEMPLDTYTFIHRYAILDSGQISMIKAWVISARKEIGYMK
jgi:Haem-binding domain